MEECVNVEKVCIRSLFLYKRPHDLILSLGQSIRSLLLPWIGMELIPMALQVAVIVIVFVYGKDDTTLSQGGVYIITGLLNIIAFGEEVGLCRVAIFRV